MTEQTAIAPRTQYDRLKAMLKADDVRARFQDVLGERAPAYMANILSAVATNDNLKECDPGSILTSALKAAVLDLPIDPNIGFLWLIPRKVKGIKKAVFQIGYKGYIQLALRTNQYEAINVVEIYEGEDIKVDRLSGRVVLNGKRTGDGIIGYCAYFKLLGGFEKYVYWTVEQIEAHRDKYAKGADNADSVWNSNFPGMAKKTVLADLLRHYGMMSVTMQRAFKDDEDANGRPLIENLEQRADVIEGEAHDPEPVQEVVQEVVQPTTFTPETSDDGHPNETAVEKLVCLGIIDNRNHAENILKKRLPDCALNEFDFGKAYQGWRDAELDGGEAAAKANAGELPK